MPFFTTTPAGGGASGTASITGGTVTGLTSLGIRNAGTGAYDVTLAINETLTAARTLTFALNDASRTLTIPASGTVALLGTANTFTVGQTIAPSSAATCLTLTSGTLTASNPYISTTQTWNNAGVTFIGEDHTFTNTAAATGSMMARWTTASRGSIVFDEVGEILLGYVGLAGCRTGNYGVSGPTGGNIHFGCDNGTALLGNTRNYGADMLIGAGRAVIRNGIYLGISSDDTSYGTADVRLYRKAAYTLQLGQDAAGVSNQMFTAANRITSDGVGANLTIAPGNGRGAAGGSLILSTFTTAGAGTAGTLTSRISIDTAGVALHYNCDSAPSGTPSGGGYLYAEAGALKWKGSSGTITTIAAA